MSHFYKTENEKLKPLLKLGTVTTVPCCGTFLTKIIWSLDSGDDIHSLKSASVTVKVNKFQLKRYCLMFMLRE